MNNSDQPARTGRRFPVATIAVYGAVLAVVVIAVWLTVHFTLPDEKADVRAEAIDDASAILAARNAVTDRWPMAVSTFGKVAVHGEGDDAVVCGEVDLEEPDDAYAGMERFTYIEGKLLIEQVDGTAAVTQSWNDVCK